MLTPSHAVSNLLHFVTQWMSRVICVTGRRMKSLHDQLLTGRGPACSVKRQSASATCGVGPADRTGKSVVTNCPGGRRPGAAAPRPLPLNPRVVIEPPYGEISP